MKVKYVHQRVEDDVIAVNKWWNVLADGNRGWNQSDAILFSQMLKKHEDTSSIDGYIEFIYVHLQRLILRMHRGL